MQWKSVVILSAVLTVAVSTAAGETLTGPHRVIDADTIEIAGERVRFSGIDAPERRQWCRRSNGICYRCGQEATAALVARIGDGAVRCKFSDRDRSG